MTNKTCQQTKVIHTKLILPEDMNNHGNLYGGRLLEILDQVTSISASRLARSKNLMTASVDRVDFLHPFSSKTSLCIESYVSGVGRTSMEVFAKVTGEDLETGDRFVGATCFFTFVVTDPDLKADPNFQLPSIQPETAEEKAVCSGYQDRRQHRLKDREFNQDFAGIVSMLPPWLDED